MVAESERGALIGRRSNSFRDVSMLSLLLFLDTCYGRDASTTVFFLQLLA